MVSPFPSAFLRILIFLALLLLTGLPIAQPSSTPSDVAGCSTKLLLLAPCTPFVQGAMPIPADACCDNLVNMFHDQSGCLCSLLNRSLSLPVNHSLVLQLPLLCHLSLTFNSNACPGGLSLPPAGSPQTQAIAGSNASSPSADVSGSPAIASPPPRRTNSLLLGVNCGGKLRVEGASLTSAIMPLVLAGALSI